MNYFKIRWKLFPILLLVSAYFFVQFFGTVAGVDMFAAIRSGVGSGGEVGNGFPVLLLLIIPAVFFLMAFAAVFVFLETPAQIFQLKGYHAGGLLGYRDGWKVHVYDPDQGAYVEYQNFTPPPAARTFKKAFPVVLFYRYRASSDLYRDTSLLGPGFYAMSLVTSAVSLFMVYICLFLVAAEYLEAGDPPIELTHQMLALRFQQVTGLAPLTALWMVLAVYVLGMVAGMVSVRVLVHQYKSRWVPQQDELRYALMQHVSPGQTIRGTVVRRHYEERQRKDTSRAVSRSGRWQTLRWPVFTVEFRELIRVPVYLNLTTRPSERALEDEGKLEQLFAGPRTVVPKESPELDFVVNPDYSISLAGKTG